MGLNIKYAIFTSLLIGVMGGLVFFVWDLINYSFVIPHAIHAGINGIIVFCMIGFILGLIIGNLK